MERAAMIGAGILDCIGDTPMLALKRIVPEGCARILLKLDSANPTGSMKDRMALAMIDAGERTGRLKPGERVVEYTGGSTGVSLALVCAARGYPLSIVTSDAFSAEKRSHMAALGAELTIVPSRGGGMDEALTRTMIAAAREITERTGAFWTDQLRNTDQLAAYHAMAEEIWAQTEGRVDAFVQATGTAAASRMSALSRSSRPSLPCSPAARAAFTGSRGRVPVSSCRSGRSASPTRSRAFRQTRR
jgi:cysteine synthase A